MNGGNVKAQSANWVCKLPHTTPFANSLFGPYVKYFRNQELRGGFVAVLATDPHCFRPVQPEHKKLDLSLE